MPDYFCQNRSAQAHVGPVQRRFHPFPALPLPGLSRGLQRPGKPVWGPWVAGAEAGFEPVNDGHGRHWTTRYPTTAFFPMAALLREARATDWSAAKTPALFLYAPADRVIDPALIPPVAAAWGGGARIVTVEMDGDDDPYAHVIAGDILSPGQTEFVVDAITDWAKGL